MTEGDGHRAASLEGGEDMFYASESGRVPVGCRLLLVSDEIPIAVVDDGRLPLLTEHRVADHADDLALAAARGFEISVAIENFHIAGALLPDDDRRRVAQQAPESPASALEMMFWTARFVHELTA